MATLLIAAVFFQGVPSSSMLQSLKAGLITLGLNPWIEATLFFIVLFWIMDRIGLI